MQSAIHIKTKVTQGKKIELELPQANVGEDVDVFIIMSEVRHNETRRSIMDILDDIHRRRPHGRDREEIDLEIQAERDAWDS